MIVDRHTAAKKIFSYLNHQISLTELVAWSEHVLLDGEVEENDVEVVSEVVAQLGLADVENFGLLWEDCEVLLSKLGYKLQIDLAKVA